MNLNKFVIEQHDGSKVTPIKKPKETTSDNSKDTIAYQCLLKNELLGAGIEDVKEQVEERKIFAPLVSRNLFSVSLPIEYKLFH